MTRLSREQIPDEVFEFVEEYLGAPVVAFENQRGGYSRGAAARLRAENGKRAFLKAICSQGFESTYSLYKREMNVLRRFPAGARVPQLIAAYESDGWIALLIEDIDGQHPSSVADIYAVLDAVATLPKATEILGLPPAAEDLTWLFDRWSDVDISFKALTPWAAKNLQRLRDVAAGALEAVAGDDLVHSDLRQDNVLIDIEGRAWLVDWPWAAKAAGWYDALLFVLDCSLNIDGVDVERTVQEHPVFEGVEAASIDSVLAGFAGYYIFAAQQPATEVAPSVREFQLKTAGALLRWLEERWDLGHDLTCGNVHTVKSGDQMVVE